MSDQVRSKYPASCYGSEIWLGDYEIDQVVAKFGDAVRKDLKEHKVPETLEMVVIRCMVAAQSKSPPWGPKHLPPPKPAAPKPAPPKVAPSTPASRVEGVVTGTGGFVPGAGPRVNVFDGAGTFGTPLLIIKKGQDLIPREAQPTSLQTGPNTFSDVQYFDVTGNFFIIKETGTGATSLRGWLAANAENYFVRWEASDNINPQTGQHRAFDLDIHPDGITEQTGLAVTKFPGLLLPEDEYQVVDPGMAVLKNATNALGALAGGVVSAAFPAPNTWSELVSKSAEAIHKTAETREGWEKAMEMLGSHKGDIGKTGLLMVQFGPTAGGGSGLVFDKQFRRKSDNRFGFGVKIGDRSAVILAAATAQLAGT